MTKNTIIPDYWYIEPLSEGNVTGAKIIYDWMQTQPDGDHWQIEFAFEYYLRGSSVNDTFQPFGTKSTPINNNFDSYYLISFADFCTYVLNKPQKPEQPEDYTYLIPLLNISSASNILKLYPLSAIICINPNTISGVIGG